MKTQTTHTKTPCHYVEVHDQKTGLIGYEIRLEDESVICEIKPKPYLVHVREENAAFIVRAVNAHEAMLKALKRVRDEAQDDNPDMWAEIDQAIAKAEGK